MNILIHVWTFKRFINELAARFRYIGLIIYLCVVKNLTQAWYLIHNWKRKHIIKHIYGIITLIIQNLTHLRLRNYNSRNIWLCNKFMYSWKFFWRKFLAPWIQYYFKFKILKRRTANAVKKMSNPGFIPQLNV